MGYLTELNTLLRPPKDFDFTSLSAGKNYTVTLEKERAFPLRIAVLLIDKDWNFYGYASAIETHLKDGKTTITFTMLTLFSKEEQALYKQKFLEAAKITGEV